MLLLFFGQPPLLLGQQTLLLRNRLEVCLLASTAFASAVEIG